MINENTKAHEEASRIPYDGALELVKDQVNKALASAPAIIRQFTGYLTESSGKYIRAMSLLICAQDKDGMIHPNAVKAAAAVEIVHLASLVHDDIIDDADVRRGKVTLQKKFGKRTAVICGDYLFCMAVKMASTGSDREKYMKLDVPDYISRVCLGELRQHIQNGYFDLSIRQYLKIISGKTAALFEASFCAGAVLSETEQPVVKKYMKLGRFIGMIFQIKDDCLDFEKTQDVVKKPVQSDYEQGVITLPLIHAFKNMLGLKEKAQNNALSRDEINQAVQKTGGLSFTHMLAKRYYDKCIALIDQLGAADAKRNYLLSVLNKAYGIA